MINQKHLQLLKEQAEQKHLIKLDIIKSASKNHKLVYNSNVLICNGRNDKLLNYLTNIINIDDFNSFIDVNSISVCKIKKEKVSITNKIINSIMYFCKQKELPITIKENTTYSNNDKYGLVISKEIKVINGDKDVTFRSFDKLLNYFKHEYKFKNTNNTNI